MTLLQDAYDTYASKTQEEICTLDLSLPTLDTEATHKKAQRQRNETEDCFGWVQNELVEMVDSALSTLKVQVSGQLALTDALMTSELDTLRSELRVTSQLVCGYTRQQDSTNFLDTIEEYIVSSLETVAEIQGVSETARKEEFLNDLEQSSRSSKEYIEKKLKIIGATRELELIEKCQSELEQLLATLRRSPLI